jgi:hypothetical protein
MGKRFNIIYADPPFCGELPRVELFAKKKTEGWTCLGNEIDGKDIHEAIKELVS